MAQLVARLVRNEKVGGSNPPSSTTGRHPIADVGFLYAWARWCGACCCVARGAAGVPAAAWLTLMGRAAVCAGGRRPAPLMVLLVAPRVFRAPEGPAAREARASLRSAPRLEARPCPPVPPAPSTPVGPGVLACGLVRRFEARPGPATAHRCGRRVT